MCDCAHNFRLHLLRPDEYRRVKRLLDIGKHPTYIGPELYKRAALQGGVVVYSFGGVDVAVSIINPRLGNMTVLCVAPDHRGHGLGSAIVRYLIPNFVRALESSAGWFAKLGYLPVCTKRGRTLNTTIMVRGELLKLAGRLRTAWTVEGVPA